TSSARESFPPFAPGESVFRVTSPCSATSGSDFNGLPISPSGSATPCSVSLRQACVKARDVRGTLGGGRSPYDTRAEASVAGRRGCAALRRRRRRAAGPWRGGGRRRTLAERRRGRALRRCPSGERVAERPRKPGRRILSELALVLDQSAEVLGR